MTNIMYFLIFLLLFIAFLFIFDALKYSGNRGGNKDKSLDLRNKKSTFISNLIRQKAVIKEELKMPKGYFEGISFLGAVMGFVIGKLYFQSTTISIFTGFIGYFAPLIFFTHRLSAVKSIKVGKLESTMLILSNAYIASDDFIKAVRDNIDIIEYPQPFKEFLVYVNMVDCNVESSLRRLEARVGNSYFSQWIDMLVMSQKNRSMKYLTLTVVDMMNDVKSAQMEIDTAMYSVWNEYTIMLFIIFSIPVILRFIMKAWYQILVTSIIGKGLLLLLLAAIIYSIITALKVSKPVNI